MKKFDLHRATAETYALFNKIRHKSLADFPPGLRYWDIVVLTASDDDQRAAYDIQIKEKLDRKEIPSGVGYHVFADPPGPRIGCGGATMHAVVRLREIYGVDELSRKFVLLINAGGQSQRLPSASVLGKIFSPLPIGEDAEKDEGEEHNETGANWQLLELKLACYTPLLSRMKPGFMHVASDTIEVFDLGEDTQDLSLSPDEIHWNFEQPGMTALAHPSTLHIGCTHGVFVLKERRVTVSQNLAELRDCCEVLQKPSLEEMHQKGAVIKNTQENRIEGPASSLDEFVYTDSAFYFDHAFASKLASFYEDFAPLGCEIDAYGDFMRSLGPQADSKFTSDTRNVSTTSSVQLKHLVEMKKRVFDCLQGCPPLNVVVMNASKFYHLGTMTEYVENLCEDEDLAGYLGFKPAVFSAITTASAEKDSLTVTKPVCHKFPGSGRRLVHSVVNTSTDIACSCVVEYCQLTSPRGFKIGRGCILANCSYTIAGSSFSNALHKLPFSITSTNNSADALIIPPDTFLHTIPVLFSDTVNLAGSGSQPVPSQPNTGVESCLGAPNSSSGSRIGFVTLVFHTGDDLKKTGTIDTIRWFGDPLFLAIDKFHRSKVHIFSSDKSSESLWHARLFPVMETMDKSFEVAVAMANGLVSPSLACDAGGTGTDEQQWVSAAEAVQYKDINSMLAYRSRLGDTIRTARMNL